MLRTAIARLRAKQGTLLVGSLVTIAFNGLAVVLYGVGTIVVARVVGPKEWGVGLWFVTGTTTVGLFADLIGIYYSNAYAVARGEQSVPPGVARSSVLAYGAVLGAVVGGASGFVPPIRRMLFPNCNDAIWGALIASSILGICLINQARGILLGNRRFLMLGGLSLVKSGGFAVCATTFALVFHLRQAQHVAWAQLASTAAAAALGVVDAWRAGLSRPRLEYIRACAKLGWRATSINTLSFLHQRADQFLVQKILGASALGLYGVAVSLGEVLTQLPAMVGMVLFPTGAKDEDRAESARRTLRITRWSVLGSGLMLIPVALVARPLVFRLYGSAYEGSVGLLMAFLPAVAFLSGLLIVNPFLAGTGYPRAQLVIMSVGLIANVTLNLTLLPTLGVVGASIASSISYALWLGLAVWYLSTVAASSVPARTEQEEQTG